MLDEIELANARIHGYGSLNFGRNLANATSTWSEREIRHEDLRTVIGLRRAHSGVPDGGDPACPTHSSTWRGATILTLFTKGHPDEQTAEDRSLRAGRILGTRDREGEGRAAYRDLVRNAAWTRRTWMIGNSPKSDINPALEAGLNAVFVPHAIPGCWSMKKSIPRPRTRDC